MDAGRHQSIPGGYPIFQWNSSKRDWEPYGTYGAVEITEAAGSTVDRSVRRKVYSKAPSR